MDEMIYDPRPAKKVYSGIGIALCVILGVTALVQILAVLIPTLIWGEKNWLVTSSWGMWLVTFVPQYLVAVPIGLALLRRLPAQAPQSRKMEGKHFWVILPMAFCLMYAGNLVGNVLSAFLSGGTAENAITDYAMDTNPLKVLVMVVLAPLIEEYIFRKQIIDRVGKYGEKTAVFLSALTFGLFHTNLFQFFYAFLLGWLFAYLYTRTGRLRYPVILHGIINFMGGVVAPYILSLMDLEAIEKMDPNLPNDQFVAQYGDMILGTMAYLLYALLLLGLSVAGLVLLIRNRKKLVWEEAPEQLPQGQTFKTVYLNVGMTVFVLLTLGMTIWMLF